MSLYTWGANNAFQCGNGDTKTDHGFEPRLVDTLEGKSVLGFALGESHSLAFTESGDLYSWGRGREGQLGHGDRGVGCEERFPTRVQALSDETVVSVCAGAFHSIAVTKSGRIYQVGRHTSLVLTLVPVAARSNSPCSLTAHTTRCRSGGWCTTRKITRTQTARAGAQVMARAAVRAGLRTWTCRTARGTRRQAWRKTCRWVHCCCPACPLPEPARTSRTHGAAGARRRRLQDASQRLQGVVQRSVMEYLTCGNGDEEGYAGMVRRGRGARPRRQTIHCPCPCR